MGYLISQIIFCLIAAAVLGVALGWLLHGMLHPVEDMELLRARLNNCLEDNHRLRADLNKQPHETTSGQETASPGEETESALENADNIAPVDTETAEEPASLESENDQQLASEEHGQPSSLADAVAQAKNSRRSHHASTQRNFSPTGGTIDTSSDRGHLDSYPVEEIEGIGKGFGKRLRNMGLETTGQLLQKGASPVGISEISEKVQIEAFVVKKWVTQADLLRLPGIEGQFAELLQASHVESVTHLASQETYSLLGHMKVVNERERRSPTLPSAQMVEEWIKLARNAAPIS